MWPKYFIQAGGTGKAIDGRCVWPLDRTFEEHILNPPREKGMAAPDAKEREAFFAMVWCGAFSRLGRVIGRLPRRSSRRSG